MPYVSDEQRKKFHAMEARGELSHSTVEHWDKETEGKKLPKRKKKRGGAEAWARRRVQRKSAS